MPRSNSWRPGGANRSSLIKCPTPYHENPTVRNVLDAIWPHEDLEALISHLSQDKSKLIVNARCGEERDTPMHWAARNGTASSVAALANAGASATACNVRGQTPLHLASEMNRCAALQALLDVMKEENTTPDVQDFHDYSKCSAVGRHIPASNPEYICNGKDHQLLDGTKSIDSIAKFLTIKKKDAPRKTGETPLHYACRSGSAACVDLLLRYGADPELPGCRGDPPLLMAARSGKSSALLSLLSAGVSPDMCRNAKGETALHVAAASGSHGYSRCIKTLLNNNCDPKSRDLKGQTAAHHAANAGNISALKVLMHHGTPLGLKNLPFPSTPKDGNEAEEGVQQPEIPPKDVDYVPNIVIQSSRARSSECLSYLLEQMMEARHRCLLPQPLPTVNTPSAQERELLALFPVLQEYTPEGGTTLQLAISRAPQLIDSLLDACIYVHDGGIDNETPPKILLDLVFFCAAPGFTEAALLLGLPSRARQKVLGHPLAQIMLALKWRLVRYFYWLLVALHLIFLVVISARVVTAHGRPLGTGNNKDDSVLQDNEDSANKKVNTTTETPDENDPVIYHQKSVIALVIALCVLMVLIEILKIFRAGWRYFRLDDNGREHILNWGVQILVAVDVSDTLPPDWARVVGAMVAFGASIQVLGLMCRFPKIGLYVVMIHRVIHSYFTLLFAYVWLFIGFALAFHLLLYEVYDYGNPALSLLKTFLMLVGEYQFPDPYQTDSYVTQVAGQILLGIYIPTMTVLLLNLIIGLTVSDMQRLFQQANYHRQVLLAQLVLYLTALLPSGAAKVVTEDLMNLETLLTAELSIDGDGEDTEAVLKFESARDMMRSTTEEQTDGVLETFEPIQQGFVLKNIELSEYTIEKLRKVLERRWGVHGFNSSYSVNSGFNSIVNSRSNTPIPTPMRLSITEDVGDVLSHLRHQQQEQQAHTDQLYQLTMQVLKALQNLKVSERRHSLIQMHNASVSPPELVFTPALSPSNSIDNLSEFQNENENDSGASGRDPPTINLELPKSIYKPTPRLERWDSFQSFDSNT